MQHDKLKPILFSVIKHTDKEELRRQIPRDIVSGIVVAIVALPLSIALAIASGVGPEQGLYTAIVAGFLIALLGGSRVQISGPTAAFVTIVAGIVATDGIDGLIAATIIAGILLALMGLLKLGTLIRFVPYTITTGFTAGIAVTIVIGQVKDLLGLTYPAGTTTIETADKLAAIGANIATINGQALLVGAVCLAILIVWPRVSRRIPGSLVAVIVGAAMVGAFNLNVNTIGDLYTINAGLPTLHVPQLDLGIFRDELANGITIAILAAIESLLSCVVADSMISGHHRCNMELVAQGVGNMGSVLFGGIPATGAIARTAANVKSGGRTPIAGMVHAAVLLLVLVFLMPYAAPASSTWWARSASARTSTTPSPTLAPSLSKRRRRRKEIVSDGPSIRLPVDNLSERRCARGIPRAHLRSTITPKTGLRRYWFGRGRLLSAGRVRLRRFGLCGFPRCGGRCAPRWPGRLRLRRFRCRWRGLSRR